MKKTQMVSSGIAFVLAITLTLHAQTTTVGNFNGNIMPIQTAQSDSIVSIVAEEQGLQLMLPDQVPAHGTFWTVLPGPGGGITAPFPCPPLDPSLPIYAIADGQFLVNGTIGSQATLNTPQAGRLAVSSTSAAALESEANAVANLISQVQTTAANQQMRTMARAMDLDVPLPGGDASGDGDVSLPMFSSNYAFPTNGLWLEITGVSNGAAWFNLHNATNQVYAIISKTNLPLATWNIEQEVWPNTNQTVTPFMVPVLDRTSMLFIRAQDWTGVDSNGDGIPDWWIWKFYGDLSKTATNLDSTGNQTLGYDYTNGLNPNVIQFSGVEVTNNYINANPVSVQLDVVGAPYYVATLVDDTNFADAVWNTYLPPNVMVNLGLTEGWHDVWIGLRGHTDAASAAVWQWLRLKRDYTLPSLVITGPTNNPINLPLIQLTGYSPEALSSISYDLSNAAGTVTNQPAMITGQSYNTNTTEFITNYFQCYDVPLTNGVNMIMLHATDLAGNMTIFTTNIIYSADTNPPTVALLWPQDGMQISGGSLTVQGQVNDPTATVAMMTVDANGNTNYFNGRIGRDGSFWVENVPLNSGTTTLALTVNNAAGGTTTNFSLSQSNVGLSINAVQAGNTTVSGSIATAGYTVWVNGVQATQTNGTWSAQITPVCVGGGLVQVTAIPNSGSSYQSTAQFQSAQSSSQGQSANTQAAVQPPQGVFISTYHLNYHITYLLYFYGSLYKNYNIVDWQDGQSGSSTSFSLDNNYYADLYVANWPASSWPQTMPNGTGINILGLVSGNDFSTLFLAQTNSGPAGPAAMRQAHCNSNRTPMNQNYNVPWYHELWNEDTEIKLATGGPLGSTQKNLWLISAGASDALTGAPIPYDQISIGNFGNLDTNGNLYVALPDNDPDTITPHVNGNKNYFFGVNGQKYTLVSQCWASTPTNLARTTIGVGEAVYVFFQPSLPINVSWTLSAGSLSSTSGPSTSFFAPSNATTTTITATVGRQSVSIPFTVIAPSGVSTTITSTRNQHISVGVAGAYMHLNVAVQPISVSFYRVKMEEIGEDASNVTGYFINHWPMSHKNSGADVWHPVGVDNLIDVANGMDSCSYYGSSHLPSPWSPGGGFIWGIPAIWNIGNGPTNSLPWSDQAFTLGANGTFTITKFGQTVTRTVNDVINPNLP